MRCSDWWLRNFVSDDTMVSGEERKRSEETQRDRYEGGKECGEGQVTRGRDKQVLLSEHTYLFSGLGEEGLSEACTP